MRVYITVVMIMVFHFLVIRELFLPNDNGVRIVNIATTKNLFVKSTMFQHRNIHKHTWTSPDGKIHKQTDHILIERTCH